MPNVINQRIDKFLGLNNCLNPSSSEYREGMAYKSLHARIDEHGLWAAQQDLVACTTPPGVQACPHATTGHFKWLSVDNVDKIVTLGLTTICDVGPNGKLYSTNGSGAVKNAGGDIAALTRPTITVTAKSGGSSRAQNGTYQYFCTMYNTTYDREGLPSATVANAEIDHDDGAKDYIQLTSGTEATATNKIRFYRSKRTSASDGIYNPANKLYYLGEITSGTTFDDYFHDNDISDAEFEGRGTMPPTAIDYLVSFENRMLYLKGNVVHWSSAGRPEEVAQQYSITIGSSTVICKPKLSIGYYGEAKVEIAELAGQKVLAAYPLQNRLYIWTAGKFGYLYSPSRGRAEGYKFVLLSDGFGVTSDKVLALSPYGLFGADRQGIWLFNGRTIQRLTDNRIDIDTATKDTYLTQANRTASFGCWVPVLNEYWWGVSGKIIAYQANLDAFAGPYSYAKGGGCMFVSAGGAQVYLTSGETPSPTAKDAAVQTLQFWFGQTAPKTVKDQLSVEIVHSAVPGANVTAKVYQNCITSTTGATDSGNIAYGTSIGQVNPSGSGRYFMLQLTLPTAGAPVANINYQYNPVGLE